MNPEMVSASAKSSVLTSGATFKVNVAVRHDHRSELELHAKFLERDGDGGESRAGLHDGEGKLTTGEEAGFLAVDRDQIGLGQNLQQILGLQRFDHGAEVNVGAEQEQVQNIADGFVGCKWPHPALRSG